MNLYGLEKLSLVDYDGHVSATLFTGNCNFRCGFCHNSSLVTDYESLPAYSQDEIFDYLKKRIGLLDGVCVTGGEPTLNKDLPTLCEKIKEIGYSIKLDTNGTNPQMVKSLFANGLIDYCAMDIKNDRASYGEIIGIKNYDTCKVEQTVEFLLSQKDNYEFRTTIIKEYHTEENIKNIGRWIKGANKYFLQKFRNNVNCICQNLNEIEQSTAEKFVEILKGFIPNTSLRGY